MNQKILVIGDTHMPWMDKAAFSWCLDVVGEYKPSIVVQIGDLYDMFSQGRWARSLDIITPKQEITQGREMADEFWWAIQKHSPKVKCFQIMGNHDSRPMKKILEKAPEIASIIDIKHFWKFDGVETIYEERQELILEDIVFMHGFRSKLGDHARYNQMSTVCGHSHQGGVVYFPIKKKIAFELNCGYLGDPNEVPLQYTKQSILKWTQGLGMIDSFGPRFIPRFW